VAPGGKLVSTDGTEVGLRQDLSPVHVVTTSVVAELGIDFRRLRPNILVEGTEGREELDWIGSSLRIGEVILEVTSPCERCVMTTFDPDTIEQDAGVLRRINADFGRYFGIHCNVTVPGAVSRGDRVTIGEA
jgi:MOSC domain-containing protein